MNITMTIMLIDAYTRGIDTTCATNRAVIVIHAPESESTTTYPAQLHIVRDPYVSLYLYPPPHKIRYHRTAWFARACRIVIHVRELKRWARDHRPSDGWQLATHTRHSSHDP